jgi:hypothetical protein
MKKKFYKKDKSVLKVNTVLASETFLFIVSWVEKLERGTGDLCSVGKQLKTTLRSHFYQFGKSQNFTNTFCWQGCGEMGTFLHCW